MLGKYHRANNILYFNKHFVCTLEKNKMQHASSHYLLSLLNGYAFHLDCKKYYHGHMSYPFFRLSENLLMQMQDGSSKKVVTKDELLSSSCNSNFPSLQAIPFAKKRP
jgi:hypothetical protein